jgi:hypothetical protein
MLRGIAEHDRAGRQRLKGRDLHGSPVLFRRFRPVFQMPNKSMKDDIWPSGRRGVSRFRESR